MTSLPNTLADIRTKVRRLTARISTQQMSDFTIDQYINTYYLYDFPENLRLLKLEDTYTFTTEPNVEVYAFENTYVNTAGDIIPAYITVSEPFYAGGQQGQYFQDPDFFYREWPKINYIQLAATGNGTNGPYTGTLTGFPFLRSTNVGSNNTKEVNQNILFSANTGFSTATNLTDDGNGNLIDPTNSNILGTINYSNGQFVATFPAAVPAGAAINASTIPYVASLPRTILFFQNQFYLRPVPDKAYIIQLKAFRFPTQFLETTPADQQEPELQQWWQLIAYGAALKILVDNGDFDNADRIRQYFDEQLMLVQRRTIKLLTSQRASTIYNNSGVGNFPYSNLYPYV